MFKDVTFLQLQDIVNKDQKGRFHLMFEPQLPASSHVPDVWWIRANQGHSMKACSRVQRVLRLPRS